MGNCQAAKMVPQVFNAAGHLFCGLPHSHQGVMHFDPKLRVWWLPALASEGPEDIPTCVRMNEDLPVAVAGEWMQP